MNAVKRGRPKGTLGETVIIGSVDQQLLTRFTRGLPIKLFRTKVVVALTVDLGLNSSQLLALNDGDVFDATGKVRDAIRVRRSARLPEYRKLTRGLKHLLADYREYLVERHLVFEDSPLIRSQRGGRMSLGSMSRYITATYRKAGLSKASSRSGRMTWLARDRLEFH